MKIGIYDPLYSTVGHFERYNKYILQMASKLEEVEAIWYFDSTAGEMDWSNIDTKISSINNPELASDSQAKLNIKRGAGKFTYLLRLMRDYAQLIRKIRTYPIDLLLFSSNGTFPFWLVVLLFWRRPYGVSVISVRWLYGETLLGCILRLLYVRYLRSARIVFVTEDCYRLALLKVGVNAFVLPDRFLEKEGGANVDGGPKGRNSTTQLVTLGTLSEEKNPINFVSLLKAVQLEGASVHYTIAGKAFGDIGGKLISSIGACSYIEFLDCYLKTEEFDSLMLAADFVVIPYDQSYTKFMTSGVLWDCFATRKPVLCPDVPLFRFYIDKYRVGFIYDANNLGSVLSSYSENRSQLLRDIQRGYDDLFNDNSFEMNLGRFRSALSAC